MKKKKTKISIKKTVPLSKPRNNNTMTESAFWGMIRAALRQKSRWWKPILATKKGAERIYKGSNKRQKYEYQCKECKDWFMAKNVEVDHIIPAGALKSGDDLKGFVDRLFCEKEGLRVLCKECHSKKTKEERK